MHKDPSDDKDDEELPARGEDYDAVRELEARLRALDGPFSASNVMVPFEANDIEDDEHPSDERPNPRASDLDYPECGEIRVDRVSDEHVVHDPDIEGDTKIRVEKGLIEDVSQFN